MFFFKCVVILTVLGQWRFGVKKLMIFVILGVSEKYAAQLLTPFFLYKKEERTGGCLKEQTTRKDEWKESALEQTKFLPYGSWASKPARRNDETRISKAWSTVAHTPNTPNPPHPLIQRAPSTDNIVVFFATNNARHHVCLQSTTNEITRLALPTPPPWYNVHHPPKAWTFFAINTKVIMFVRNQQRTRFPPPTPPPWYNVHHPPKTWTFFAINECHHVCLQATTNEINPPTPHPTPCTKKQKYL